MSPFYAEVETLEQGVLLLDVLARYDQFQYENNVKPDYCNAGGIQVLDDDGDWVDWYDDETGEDDPAVFLRRKVA